MSATSLTLYDLSRELVELMDRWDDPDTRPEDRTAIENDLTIYIEQHVRKVDGVRAYLRHCSIMKAVAKQEARRLSDLSETWEAREQRLKDLCQVIMETFGAKRLDGNTGSLLLKGNGGKQPVRIDSPELVPDEFCTLNISVNKATWAAFQERLEADSNSRLALSALISSQSFHGDSEPRKSLIEAELQKPCPNCIGGVMPSGVVIVPLTPVEQPCSACGGSGKRGVPGCTLEPRGVHLEVK